MVNAKRGSKNRHERIKTMGLISVILGKTTKKIPTVCNVDLNRYLGTWYEIARLPHSFEEGLGNVTASYNLRSDGNIEVTNTGYKNGEKKEVKGVAFVPSQNCTGRLLVSFFWFFKSEYKIILLDDVNYSYAVVTSSSRDYLWILNRDPIISDSLYEELVSFALSKGFDVQRLIKVKQL